jgi:hypothetical protein
LAVEFGTENLSQNFGNKLPTARNKNTREGRINFPDTLRLICETKQIPKFFSGVVIQTFFVLLRHAVYGKDERRSDKRLVYHKNMGM